MSRFADLLNEKLPSQVEGNDTTESTDDMFDSLLAEANMNEEDDVDTDDMTEEEDTTVDTDDIGDIEASDDDFDPDDMDDEELANIDSELVGGDDAQVSLSPEEEIKADDMMSVAATTLLVNDELNVEEKVEFLKNEAQTAINEGFMTATDVNQMSQNLGLVTEANYNRKMIIRLDAESKKKQLYALAINVSAAAHNDPDYIKLKKVMKMRKILRAKLEKKYHSEAMKRMKIYYARLRNSKSNTLKEVGKKNSK